MRTNKVMGKLSIFIIIVLFGTLAISANSLALDDETMINDSESIGDVPEQLNEGILKDEPEPVDTGVKEIVCGNNICQPGQNSYNCPEDCAISQFESTINISSKRFVLETSESRLAKLEIEERINKSQILEVFFSGPISEYTTTNISDYDFEMEGKTILFPRETLPILVNFTAPATLPTDPIFGYLEIRTNYSTERRFYEFEVTEKKNILPLDIALLDDTISEGENLSLQYFFPTYDRPQGIHILDFKIVHGSENDLVYETNKEINFNNTIGVITEDIWEDNHSFDDGSYRVHLSGNVNNLSINSSAFFSIQSPLVSTSVLWWGLSIIFIIIFVIAGFFAYKKYKVYKLSKMRYISPDFRKLPKGDEDSFWVGKIAETNKSAYIFPPDLTTHALVSGSTGSGKSVTASVIVEEALLKKRSVVVFDPTSQWTGFVKQCKDKNILKMYKEFNMSEDESKPFRGLIYNVEKPDVDLDIKKYLIPGEVTVFNLANLKPGEYDLAVQAIVDKVFECRWDESPDLKTVFVFDEVHRLLEKYGGSGGYKALEKACREFRKWGIGMVMVSQVSADFKEAVAGNILTEVQLNTKSMEDIKKIAHKHGNIYSTKVTRQGIGVGMIQNPKYNDGKPYFVHFRPTLHDPHNLPKNELKKYMEYSERLDVFEFMITNAEENDKDVEDIKLEFKMTKNKLKEGKFKMVDMYLKSLSEKLSGKVTGDVDSLIDNK